MRDSEMEAFLMSEELVNELVKDIVCLTSQLRVYSRCLDTAELSDTACLYPIAEAVSLSLFRDAQTDTQLLQIGTLDMLCSFAEVSIRNRYSSFLRRTAVNIRIPEVKLILSYYTARPKFTNSLAVRKSGQTVVRYWNTALMLSLPDQER